MLKICHAVCRILAIVSIRVELDHLHKDQVEERVLRVFFLFSLSCYCVCPRPYTIFFIRPWHNVASAAFEASTS